MAAVRKDFGKYGWSLAAGGSTMDQRPTNRDFDLNDAYGIFMSTREILRDGTPVTIRPLKRDDIGLDEATEAAFVALAIESGVEREVGVARMSAIGDGRAEFAVTVRDDWQHKRLGTLLTKQVIESARQRGLNALYSVDASENRPMNEFAKTLGFGSDVNPRDATEVMHTLQLN